GWGKLYSPLLARDVCRVRVTYEPSGIRVEPHVETVLLNRLDHPLGHPLREILLIDHRSMVGLDQHAPIERGEGLSEFQRIDQLAHPSRRPAAGDTELDSRLAEMQHSLGRALRQCLFLRNQRSINISDDHADRLC